MISCCYKNILETSTVLLTAGTENTSFPLKRLFNRDIGLYFKITAAVTMEIKVDQSSAPIAIDKLIVPPDHNMSGMTLDIKYSDNDVDWYAVDQWVQGDNNLIVKVWASATHDYWKFIVTNPGTIPQLTELFLCPTSVWTKDAGRKQSGPFDDKLNLEEMETGGGQDRFLEHGDNRRQRLYYVPSCPAAQKNVIHEIWQQKKKPFFLYDHEGTWIFGKLRRPPGIRPVTASNWSYTFDFIEVLP